MRHYQDCQRGQNTDLVVTGTKNIHSGFDIVQTWLSGGRGGVTRYTANQTEWTHTSSVQTPRHHVHIHACLTPPSWPHTHTHTNVLKLHKEPGWKKTTHFLSPKAQGKLLFHIHSDNQVNPFNKDTSRKGYALCGNEKKWKAIEEGGKNANKKKGEKMERLSTKAAV